MEIEQEFREGVKGCLVQLTDKVIPLLQKLIRHDYPDEVVSLDFEVFTDGFTQEFPVRAFFMDSDNTEFFLYEGDKAIYPSPIDPGFPEMPYVYTDEFEESFIEKNEELDTYTLAGYKLIEWFSTCWQMAGGETFKLRANIMLHDDTKVFNLNSYKWEELY